MRKILSLSLALIAVSASFAQGNEQIQNKNGVDIMPVAGEFAVGMNALPVMAYLGNVFGLTGSNNSLAGNKFVNYFASNTLFGKYMLSNDNAVRAHFRMGQYNNTYRNDVFNDTENDPLEMVEDLLVTRSSFYNIGVGYEWRRGTTRLRGIYGGELMYQFVRGDKADYTYGNTFGNGNPAPTATTWNAGGVAIGEGPLAERMLSVDGGNYNGVGLRAFVGVEYYIAPKICIGTEFGYGMTIGKIGESSSKVEYWDPTAEGGVITFKDVTTSSANSFILDTDNFGGSLYLMFYF